MKRIIIGIVILSIGIVAFFIGRNVIWGAKYPIGEPIDTLNGVVVYYNGSTGNVLEQNTTKDGYNLGLKYQSVEFVKRYYYEIYNHKMPDSYGDAIDFFDPHLREGHTNKKRNLRQYENPGASKPKVGDLIVFDKTWFNRDGHVAIVSEVTEDDFEIIQQNPGAYEKSRVRFKMYQTENASWFVENKRILGWLRKNN